MKKTTLKSLPDFYNHPAIKFFFKLSIENDFNTWIVGGAVRDHIIGRDVNDIDFVSDLEPKKMLEIFQKHDVQFEDTFFHYGTLVVNLFNKRYFITSLREDYDYDGRHSKIKFTKELSVDAKRRDLTINSLYLNKNGEIIDFFNGIDDIKNSKLIFINGIKQKCFEDHLRIIRYIRFCSMFKNPFIPNEYKKFFVKNSFMVKKVNKKKWIYEIKKIFENEFFLNSVLLLKDLKIVDYILEKVLINETNLKKELCIFFK